MHARFPRGFSLIEVLLVVALFAALSAVLLPAVARSRDAASRTICGNHLRNQAVALVATHDATGHYPPGDDARQRLHHAWSSRILPSLEQQSLHGAMRYQQPWNDPAGNAIVVQQVVDVFRCPGSELEFPGDTDYAGLQGTLAAPGRRWGEGARSGVLVRVDRRHPGLVREKDIRDGASRTLVIAESADRAAEDHGMWADGLGIIVQGSTRVNEGKGEINGPHLGGANVAYADARVEFLGDGIDPLVLATLCTKANGDNTDMPASRD